MVMKHVRAIGWQEGEMYWGLELERNQDKPQAMKDEYPQLLRNGRHSYYWESVEYQTLWWKI
jgi:hypothetical protein